MDELQQFEEWAGPLLARLTPAARSALARTIGVELRRSQSARIQTQRAPDGSPYVPRKRRLRDQAGKIKRGVMFAKLRQARYLKVRASHDEVTLGFLGRVSRIARVHQEGQMDAVRPGGPRVRYAHRPLLGFSAQDTQRVRDLLIDHLSGV